MYRDKVVVDDLHWIYRYCVIIALNIMLYVTAEPGSPQEATEAGVHPAVPESRLVAPQN